MSGSRITEMMKTISSDSLLGFWWLGLSLFCGTVFFISTKYLLANMTTADFFCWWYGLGLVFHALYGLKKRGIRLEDLKGEHLLHLGLYVILDITGTIAFFNAIRLMDPSVSSFLNQSHIIFTLILGYIVLKEALDIKEVGAAAIIIIGVVVMTYRSVAVPPAGIANMMFANLTAAANLIIVRRCGSCIGTITFARIRTITLFTLFLGLNLAKNGAVGVPGATVLMVMVLGSFFGPFLNIVAMYKALEYLPAGKLTLLKSVQPLMVTAASGIILSTIPGGRELTGGIIVTAGCLALAVFHAHKAMAVIRPLRSPLRQ